MSKGKRKSSGGFEQWITNLGIIVVVTISLQLASALVALACDGSIPPTLLVQQSESSLSVIFGQS
jgi:hypothetical protein